MSPKAHAFLSPSASSRWLACVAAPWMESRGVVVEESSPYAEEGTRAHAEAEECVTAMLNGESLEVALTHLKDVTLEPFIRAYLEEIASTYFEAPEFFAVEKRINLREVYGLNEDAFGTADCIAVCGGVLHVFDYKHGVGVPVSAVANTQLSIYALGFLKSWEGPEISEAVLHIVQPRLPMGPTVSRFSISVEDLEFFEAQVEDAAEAANRIRIAGFASEDDFAPSAETCRFCKARASCEAHAQITARALGLPKTLPPADIANDEELGAVLAFKPLAEAFFKDIEEEAYKRLLAGHEVPGFKLVEGNLGKRTWFDDAQVEEVLKAMRLNKDQIYVRTLISPTKAEGLKKKGIIGEGQWKKLELMVTRRKGKPQLVPATDKRPQLMADIEDEMEVLPNG